MKLNKQNKLYIVAGNYNDFINIDRVYKRYTNAGNYYTLKKDVPKHAKYLVCLKFAADTQNLEYIRKKEVF